MDFKFKYNDKQKEAVEFYGAPLLILAGAGSGKTRCVVGKIFDLLSKGLPLERILAFTFTNKAAEELKSRIKEKYVVSKNCWIGTIHSICVKILKRQKERFEICDSSDTLKFVKESMKNANVDSKEIKPSMVASKISKAKMSMFLPRHATGSVMGNKHVKFSALEIKVYEEYDRMLKACGLKDFDDLILDVVILLEKNPKIREKYLQIFEYVMVDEYQDINPVQDKLIKLLSGDGDKLVVVGDDQQSIYGFRGSDPSFIIEFQKYYRHSKVVKLEQNYRSNSNILEAANGIVSKAETGLKKELWTENETGSKIEYTVLKDDAEEAKYVCSVIDTMVTLGKASYKDFAVLYRTNRQGERIDVSMIEKKIPHILVNSLSFFERAEIRDVLAYLKLIVNPKNVIAFKRSATTPAKGIGSKTQEEVIKLAKKRFGGDMLMALKEGNGKCQKFADFIRKVRDEFIITASDVIDMVVKEFEYEEYLSKKYQDKDFQKRMEKISMLKELADSKSHTLDTFLEEVVLKNETDNYDSEEDTVKLMTIHGAKGLEFKRVILIGVEDELIPFVSIRNDFFQYAEERRLFYVAVTRAEKKLIMTRAESRLINGEYRDTEESPFLADIPEGLLEIKEL